MLFALVILLLLPFPTLFTLLLTALLTVAGRRILLAEQVGQVILVLLEQLLVDQSVDDGLDGAEGLQV